MNDSYFACVFLLFFFVCCFLYGCWIKKTGNKDLLPYRAQHSIASVDDVRRVGFWTLVVGGIGACICLVLVLVFVFLSN